MVILKYLAFSLLLIASLESKAQISFYHIFGGKGYDKGAGIAQLPDSSYIVTGSSSSFEDAPSQAFLLKLNKQGFHTWSKEYGGSESDEGKRVIFVPDFGYYIIGTSSSNGTGGFDGYVVFTDLSGNQQWEKWYDNGGWERFHDAVLLPDTSIVLMGETDANQEQIPDQYVMRINKTGDIMWEQQLGDTGLDLLHKGVRVTDTTFATVGTAYLADSLKSKGYIGYFHINGSIIWDTLVGNNGEYLLNDVQFAFNFLVCAGEKTMTGKTDTDNYHIFLGQAGNYVLSDEYYTPNNSRYTCFVNYTAGTGDKYFVVTQGIDPQNSFSGGEDNVINRFGFGFNWDGYGAGYNGLGQDEVSQIIRTNDGYAIAVGYHSDSGFTTGGTSLFVVKIGDDSYFPPSGNQTVYSILNIEDLQNNTNISIYPNPFTDKIQVDIKGNMEYMEVIDLTGKKVYSSNAPVTSIETSSWQQGTYLVRCQSNGSWYTGKLIK